MTRFKCPNKKEKNKCKCEQCKIRRNFINKISRDKPESKAKLKLWIKNNKERVRLIKKKWRQKNPDKMLARLVKWRINNKDHLKEYNSRHSKEYNKTHKGLIRSISRKTKIKRLNRVPIWADIKEINKIYQESIDRSNNSDIKYVVDHIIPLQGKLVSGLHIHSNLQVLDWNINIKKSNKFIPEVISF